MFGWTVRGAAALISLALAAHFDLGLGALPAAQAPQEVGSIRVLVPQRDRFVVRATLPVAPRHYDRQQCPFKIVDPDGVALNTQWERVARLQDHHVYELRALVENRWSSWQDFRVIEGDNDWSERDYDAASWDLVTLRDQIRIELELQDGRRVGSSLSGISPKTSWYRNGPATITLRKHQKGPYGGVHSWLTLNARSEQIEVLLNLHNGAIPANPDVYFRAARLFLPPGWTWTPLLPDPAIGQGYLIRPGEHVLPQRMERAFRIIVHRPGVTPDLFEQGWGVGDWSGGGYMAQGIRLPDLSHAPIDHLPERLERYADLAANAPTSPGSPPVSFLWPARGVFYGGMTGGIDIDQFPGIPLAVTGQSNGVMIEYVEQLRYGARQPGCIYEADGDPIEMDGYLNPDGTAPWSMFNSTFQKTGGIVRDAPFDFSLTGPGNGNSTYDPLDFDPIDSQHLVRRTKANKVLAWLLNDPLAKQYLRMDAELCRMTFYEGPGGRLKAPSIPGLGINMGRAHGWAADAMASAYALSNLRWRLRSNAWFETFRTALQSAQMPSGLFGATIDGKIAENPPYGNGQTAWYYAHRSSEQVFLMLGLKAIQETVGLDSSEALRRTGEGLWHLAWKPGTTGVLDRYPAGPRNGPRYTTRAAIPTGLTQSVPQYSFHVGSGLAMAAEEGAAMIPALKAMTSSTTLRGALWQLERDGIDNIANRANLLESLQSLLD